MELITRVKALLRRTETIKEDVLSVGNNDANNLGNHFDRPEVKDAIVYGVGESVRESDTMNMRTFYYAMLLEDGTVLRVATEARSIISVFLSAFSVIFLIIVAIIITCVVISHLLTNPEFTKIDIYDIAEERVELLKNNAREKNVSITLSGEHCLVTSNRGLLMELLDNLIQNAIRYNIQNGTVNVCIRQNENLTEFVVSDTGIGIPLKEQERIFERFYRVDKSRSRETGGTGLGLAIVKHIVELHDGEIYIESEEGKGSSFHVTLYVAKN